MDEPNERLFISAFDRSHELTFESEFEYTTRMGKGKTPGAPPSYVRVLDAADGKWAARRTASISANTPLVQRIGSKLEKARKRQKRTPQQVADSADCLVDQVATIESGSGIPLGCGHFSHLVRAGYGLNLRDLIRAATDESAADDEEEHSYPFRPATSCLAAETDPDLQPTPVLIGGDIENFSWALPLGTLTDSNLVVELHQLEPDSTRGCLPGEAVIWVLVGRLEVRFDKTTKKPARRHHLRQYWGLHYKTGAKHYISSDTTTVFLLVRFSPQKAGTSGRSK